MSAVQWEAMAVICARADGGAATYVVDHQPQGDAAVMRATIGALEHRGFVKVDADRAWPTDAGRRAYRAWTRRGRGR